MQSNKGKVSSIDSPNSLMLLVPESLFSFSCHLYHNSQDAHSSSKQSLLSGLMPFTLTVHTISTLCPLELITTCNGRNWAITISHIFSFVQSSPPILSHIWTSILPFLLFFDQDLVLWPFPFVIVHRDPHVLTSVPAQWTACAAACSPNSSCLESTPVPLNSLEKTTWRTQIFFLTWPT